jgi:hypothetical protein
MPKLNKLGFLLNPDVNEAQQCVNTSTHKLDCELKAGGCVTSTHSLQEPARKDEKQSPVEYVSQHQELDSNRQEGGHKKRTSNESEAVAPVQRTCWPGSLNSMVLISASTNHLLAGNKRKVFHYAGCRYTKAPYGSQLNQVITRGYIPIVFWQLRSIWF